MIPEYPKLKSLELEDLKNLGKHLELNPKAVCEFSPTNLFIWKDFDRPRLTLINGNLCIKISPPNEPPYFLEPIGNNKLPETAKTCLSETGKISRVSESFLSLIPQESLKIKCLRDHFDYIYSTKELAELKGKKFDGKRNHIKKFQSRFPEYKFIPLEPEMKRAAMDLFEKWYKARKQTRYFPKFAHESQKKALEESFKYFNELRLVGGSLFVGKALKGFSIGSELNRETVSVHLQYGDPSTQGTSQVILWEACKKIYSKYTLINLEQDLGIPGLRKSKLSYHPYKLERKFEIEV